MSGVPIWLGPDDRPLAGWLHIPDRGNARGGVVLCPTFGIEALVAQPVYRLLAIALEKAGFAVLRFDYLATGDSFGSLEDDASMDAWLESVAEATTFIRGCDVKRVGILGLRFGGTMAAIAAARDGNIDSLALWDPCASGRAFLREQQALEAMSLGTARPSEKSDAIDLVAFQLPGKLADDMKKFRLELDHPQFTRRTLLVERPDRPKNSQVEAWLAKSEINRIDAHGQSEFIDVEPGLSQIPHRTISEITSWFIDEFPNSFHPVHAFGRSHATAARDEIGRPILERAVSFGSSDLFGILTEPAVATDAPAVILLNEGLLPHVGPGRLWVDLARDWAKDGLRVLRFDLGGIGESPAHPGCQPHVCHPLDGVADIAEAASFLSPDDPSRVVLIGICSGAYHAVEAGIALGVQGVALVNPVLYFDPPEIKVRQDLASHRVAVQPVHGVVRWMRSNRFVVRIASGTSVQRVRQSELLARMVDDWLPRFIWQFLDRTGWFRSGARPMEALASAGTTTLLVCGKKESRIFRRSSGRLDALAKGGSFRFEVLDDLDHSVFSTWSRCTITDQLRKYLSGQFERTQRAIHQQMEDPSNRDQSVAGFDDSALLPWSEWEEPLTAYSNSRSVD